MKFEEKMLAKHNSLRRHYYVELTLILVIYFLLIVSFSFLFTFTYVDLFDPLLFTILMIVILTLYFVFTVVYLPIKFYKLQKILSLTFFNEALEYGLNFIPNPEGGEDFNYPLLLQEAGIEVDTTNVIIRRFEYRKRLIHILYFKSEDKGSFLIHIPHIASPYYCQINNNGCKAPQNYKDIPISKIDFASPYNLSYFVSDGLQNAKIYLRKELESRFVALFEFRNQSYQYITTYSDEFLYLPDNDEFYSLALAKKQPLEFYDLRLTHYKRLQNTINIMLEKGR